MLGRLANRLKEAGAELTARRAASRAWRHARLLPRDAGADGVVDFSPEASGIQPWQYPDDFCSLARVVEARRPRTVLEIGTADGGTLFAHARLADENALIVSIDLPRGLFGDGYPEWRIRLYESFAGPGQRLELLQVDSHAASTAVRLEQILDGRRIDYAFIDGDHTYGGVLQDFELCRRFAADDAVIAFHDVVRHPPESGCAVHDLWIKLRQEHPHEEFVKDWNQGCNGIGVLMLDSAAGPDPS